MSSVFQIFFPMEEVITDKLQGSIEGVVTGSVSLVVGKRGKALYTDGVDQWVNFGNQKHTCLGNLTVCHKGFVMALWLKAHGTDEYYVSSGGYAVQSVVICVLMKSSKLVAIVRNETIAWYAEMMTLFDRNVWSHVALTWRRAVEGKCTCMSMGNWWQKTWVDITFWVISSLPGLISFLEVLINPNISEVNSPARWVWMNSQSGTPYLTPMK